MTNYLNFKLSTDVEKNPGPTQNNTDSHETIIKPVMQSMILVDSRLYELGLQAIDVGGAGDCFFRLCITSVTVYMEITTVICKSVVLKFNI